MVIARKEHKCGECRATIRKGQEYEYVSGLWDGDFGVHKTCMKCVTIRNHFMPDGWVYGWLDQGLIDAGLDPKHIRARWWMDEKDKTIAALVDLVCELVEEKAMQVEAENE